MSQAEHDKLASAIMITTDMGIAERTRGEIERQSAELSRREIIDRSISDYGAIIVCDDMDYAGRRNLPRPRPRKSLCIRNALKYALPCAVLCGSSPE